jgi:hypothetical protein
MALHSFDIQVSPDGSGEVIVDGIDLANKLAGFDFITRPGQVPKLVLYENATGSLTGLADLVVATGGYGALLEALDSIDPVALDRTVLEDPEVEADTEDDGRIARGFLRAIRAEIKSREPDGQ